MRAWGNNTDRVLAALDELGPLTPLQLGDYLRLDKATMCSIMNRLRTGKTGAATPAPKRVYIARWVRHVAGKKPNLRPVYARGSLPCAPKPPAKTVREINADQWRRRKAIAAASAADPAT